MKKLYFAAAAMLVAGTPSLAASPDWWLVSGGPGAQSVQFVDAASIEKRDKRVSFNVATYWNDGRNTAQKVTMTCDDQTVDNDHSDLQRFACGSVETRMSNSLKLGNTDPNWLAKTVLSMPS